MMTSGGPSESPVKRHVAKEEDQPKFIIITLTGYSVTQKNTECCGFTRSKCLNVVFSTAHFSYFYTLRKYISETESATEAQ